MEECACRKPCSSQEQSIYAKKPHVGSSIDVDGFITDAAARGQPQLQQLHLVATVAADVTSKCQLLGCLPCRGEVADAVVMDKKNYGFVTFADPKIAMKFLEVCSQGNAAAAAAAATTAAAAWRKLKEQPLATQYAQAGLRAVTCSGADGQRLQ
jgi:hypothetical protein